jgi:cell wall-associated NlpC family hydrolase
MGQPRPAGTDKQGHSKIFWALVILLPVMLLVTPAFLVAILGATMGGSIIYEAAPTDDQQTNIQQGMMDPDWFGDAITAGQQYRVPWALVLGVAYATTDYGSRSPYSTAVETNPDVPPIGGGTNQGYGDVLLSRNAAAGIDTGDPQASMNAVAQDLYTDGQSVFTDAGIGWGDAVQDPFSTADEPLWVQAVQQLGAQVPGDTITVGPCAADAQWSGVPASTLVEWPYQCGTPPTRPPPTCTTSTSTTGTGKNKKTVTKTVCVPYKGTLSATPLEPWSDYASQTVAWAAALVGSSTDWLTSYTCSVTGASGSAGTSQINPIDPSQTQIVQTIIGIGKTLGIPQFGWVVAVAVADDESGLQNLDYGLGDSLGVFQQQGSEGWGSASQRTTPTDAAEAFYGAQPVGMTSNTGLLEVPGWQSMSVGQAGQSVQNPGPLNPGNLAYLEAVQADAAAATNYVAANAGTPPISLPLPAQETYQGAVSTGATGTTIPGATGTTVPGSSVATPNCSSYVDVPGQAGAVIAAAEAYLNTPYSWGGGGISTRTTPGGPVDGPAGPGYGVDQGADIDGFDCSGLVQYAFYVGANISLPRDSEDQYTATDGRSVPYDQLQPGDLVFYEPGPTGPGHVTIYIGSGQLIQAPYTGADVDIIPLYSNGFVGATRILSDTTSATTTTTTPGATTIPAATTSGPANTTTTLP